MPETTALRVDGRLVPMDRDTPPPRRDRSARREVRNPVLGLPAAKLALVELTPDEKSRLRRVLLAIRDDARERAEKAWKTHKPPMAVYWKAVGVVCNHIARVLV